MAESRKLAPEEVRLFMTGEHPGFAAQRSRFKHLPSDPRCKICFAPFSGLGAVALRRLGYGRSSNPALCLKCTVELGKAGVRGVEIPCTMLFSDVRGSTALGERLRPTEFHAFLQQFYRLATRSIVDNDGIVDKLVGDEVIGLFFGGVSGPDHVGAGIRAAQQLVELASRADATPLGSIPVGTAVHTGDAFVGATGPAEAVEDFTALGDCVNATARLAAAAGPGELLVSMRAAQAARVSIEGLERRTLELRGRTEPVEVVVLRAGSGSGVGPATQS